MKKNFFNCYLKRQLSNPIQDGPFWDSSRIGKAHIAQNLSDISYSNETWHTYTLLKVDKEYV